MLGWAKRLPERAPVEPFRGVAQPIAVIVEVELRAVFAGGASLVMLHSRPWRHHHPPASPPRALAEVALLPVGWEEALVESAQRLPDRPREGHRRAVNRPDISDLVILTGVALAGLAIGREHNRQL